MMLEELGAVGIPDWWVFRQQWGWDGTQGGMRAWERSVKLGLGYWFLVPSMKTHHRGCGTG